MDVPSPVLDLGELRLRAFTDADVGSLAAHANDPTVAGNMSDAFPHPYTEDDARAFLALASSRPRPEMHFALELEGAAVGGLGVVPLTDVNRRTCLLGYWLGAAHRGKGLATRALAAATLWAFGQGFVRAQAHVYSWNAASARVCEKAGYLLEGRLRRHVSKGDREGDLLVFARLASDPEPPPPRYSERTKLDPRAKGAG